MSEQQTIAGPRARRVPKEKDGMLRQLCAAIEHYAKEIDRITTKIDRGETITEAEAALIVEAARRRVVVSRKGLKFSAAKKVAS